MQPATTDIYTLSLHDALPICRPGTGWGRGDAPAGPHTGRPHRRPGWGRPVCGPAGDGGRSEEHTSELQSRFDLVCRLLLEKKNCKNAYLFTTMIMTRGSSPHS